jgi:uncharacterized repeat protein (TIGR01451 family)
MKRTSTLTNLQASFCNLQSSPWLLLLLPIALVALFALQARAQGPFFPPGPLLPPYADLLLHVRVAGPEGMTVTLYRGGPKGQVVAAPCQVGLRPGYIYRVAIHGVPGFPGLSFYPTLEVRGSLAGGHGVRTADFPATLTFTLEDFRAIARQALLTKAVVLERPDLALPVATQRDRLLELPVAPGSDPVKEAGTHGRVLLVLRLGEREMNEAELASSGLPGTVLLPGETTLAAPPVPPYLPWRCWPILVDPIHGPEPGSAEICIPDGGDSGMPAGFDVEGRLRGLDPSDTMAEYQDSLGRRRLAISNRICLCVPRFLVLRGEILTNREVVALGPGGLRVAQAGNLIQTGQTPVQERQQEHPGAVLTPQRLSGALSFTGTAIYGQLEGTTVTGTVRGPRSVDATCMGPQEAPADCPLIVDKWPDRCAAQIGDIVTFTLRYRNPGGRPITNVVVLDSLASRYEFILGSARADRPHTFTTQPNEAGSHILRWQINDPLPPRESGRITFQVRIR